VIIGPQHERPQAGDGDRFTDSVSIDFSDPDGTLCALVRVTRNPAAGSVHALALAFAAGEEALRVDTGSDAGLESWDLVKLEGIELATHSPLERWRVSLAGAGLSLDLEARAASPPFELPEPGRSPGAPRSYEQLCELDGSATLGGRSQAVRCIGRRVHGWGTEDWTRIELRRSIYAASEAMRAVFVESARPAGSEGHGDELRVAGLLSRDDAELHPFEDAHISTVYGSHGLPVKFGLELFVADDDLPQRLGGEAVCGTQADDGEVRLTVSFVRWSMDGMPAVGAYQSLASK
jgi:hypothetical protein